MPKNGGVLPKALEVCVFLLRIAEAVRKRREENIQAWRRKENEKKNSSKNIF